jgi:guanylate kinase
VTKADAGIPFVVSGPSGCGKTSILRRVLEEDRNVRFSVSHTTRPARKGERDGRDYWFVDPARFGELVAAGEFLEHAEYQAHQYGTSHAAVEDLTRRGLDVILEVEIVGARQLRQRLGDAVFIGVLPPSSEVLAERLARRGSDGPEVIEKRLARAAEETRELREEYDYLVVNDDLERAVSDVLHVIGASRVRRERVAKAIRDRLEFE